MGKGGREGKAAYQEVRKGGREGQAANQMLASQLPWGQLELGPAGVSGSQGRACTQDKEGPGGWGMNTSTPGCHWLGATLGLLLIHCIWLPYYDMASPFFL